MAMPSGIGIIDTLIGFLDPELHAANPDLYMFKDAPAPPAAAELDPVGYTVDAMDRNGVEMGLVTVVSQTAQAALQRYPDRFVPGTAVDPNRPMEAVRQIVHDHELWGVRAVSVFPAGVFPQVAINDKLMYPVYAKCVELGISVWVNTGVPVPRLRFECQYTGLIDEVMSDFPDLTFVMMHGAEPWTELAVKLMLKWPGLHYATSAFAPKYYPADIVNYANTRGADKVLYAGYFPMGLTLERIVAELDGVPFRDHVWSKFLRENALRVLGIGG
jgi:predicted TIM-barrel fold metal-dependent hydrolase